MNTTTEQAWEAFHAPLYQFIRRRVADSATAEDLLQEVFLKIHQHGNSLKDTRRLESWIYQITRNLIIDSYRSQRQPMTSLDAGEALDLPEELPDDDIVSELLSCVRAMVLSLPDQDRQALILTEYQGLTQKELGERLGLSFSGAKSRVQRAREKLKQELLACCHFELDRRGHILDYQPRCDCCEQDPRETQACQHKTHQMRPLLSMSVSPSEGKREGHGALLMGRNGSVWTDQSIGFRRRSVSSPSQTLAGEVLECELEPGARITYDRPPKSGLEHHLFLIDGQLEVSIDGQTYDLQPGDCLRYQLFGSSMFATPEHYAARYILFIV